MRRGWLSDQQERWSKGIEGVAHLGLGSVEAISRGRCERDLVEMR